MSHNSYGLRKQKVENEAAEKLQAIRGERHYTHEDVEQMEERWMWRTVFYVALTVLVMIIVDVVLSHPS